MRSVLKEVDTLATKEVLKSIPNNLNALRNDISVLTGKIDNNELRVNKLEQDITTMKTDITALQSTSDSGHVMVLKVCMTKNNCLQRCLIIHIDFTMLFCITSQKEIQNAQKLRRVMI